MSLLNYTTKVEAHKTIGEITQILARIGASAILHEFDTNGYIVALSFRIRLNENEISFRLPTDWRPVLEVMEHDRRVPRSQCTQQQALRVAWRITKDWIAAQAAFIDTMMVTTAQVFLPYAVTANGQSLYEYIGQNTGLLLGDGSNDQQG